MDLVMDRAYSHGKQSFILSFLFPTSPFDSVFFLKQLSFVECKLISTVMVFVS